MAFDPRTIRTGIKNKPRKVVIYGPPKIGKSSLVSSAGKSLLVPTEDRVDHIDANKTDVIKSYDEIMEIFEWALEDKQYGTLIIDTIDWLEPMIWAHVCEKKGFASLVEDKNKETNFGKGLKYHAVEGWKIFLQNCDLLREEAGKNIILVAHASVEKIDPPDGDAYDRYNLDVDKHAAAVVFEWADIVGFYNREVLVKTETVGTNKKGKVVATDDTRNLNLQTKSPAWISGNSFGLRDCIVKVDVMADIMRYVLTGSGEIE